MTKLHLSTASGVLGVLLLAGSAAAGQASMLDASEASAFMGTWVISFESPRGRLEGAGNARAKMARCPDGRQRRDRAFRTKRAKNSKELLVFCESRRRPIIPV